MADFIDYAILGIKTFSNTVPYTRLLKEKLFAIIAIIVPVSLILSIIIYIYTLTKSTVILKKIEKRLRIFLAYSIASITIIYPIADKEHFAIGSICTLLTIIYLIYEIGVYIITKKERKKLIFILKTFFKTVAILLLVVCTLKETIYLTKYILSTKNQTYLNHFKYIPTDENLKQRIEKVDQYILLEKENGKKVYILDTMAAAFIIPTNMYNKNYDMFNLGNLGSKGENGIIEELKKEEDIIILVIGENYQKNWQLPVNVINFIRQDFNKIGNIDVFDIYVK